MRRLLPAATWLILRPAIALADDQLPPLQPAHGELPPTFWELHGWAVAAAGLVVLVLLVLLILLLRRPKAAVVVPPDVLARQALEALRGQPENGVLLMKVSGILRRYVIFACGLPPGELTTAELCQAVADRPQFSPGLAADIAAFFRQCDERKFAPVPPAAELGAVAGALALLEKTEQCRRQMSSLSPQSAATPPS